MPQKPSKFQSKSRRDGGNFSSRSDGGAGKGRGGFSKSFDGDKRGRDEGRGRSGDRKPASKPYGDRKFDDKKGGKSFGDRKPYGEKKFGDRKEGGGFGDKKFGDRKPYGDKPFGEKKFGDRKPAGRSFGDKKFGDRKPYGDKKFGDRPQRSFDDRPSRAPASDETRQKLKSSRPNYGSPSPAYLYGVHPVVQALLNEQRQHTRLLATERGLASIEKAMKRAQADGLTVPPVTLVESEDIARLLPRDAVHQDVLLDTQPLEEVFLPDILLHAGKNATVVVLDQVTDPHNVGAIMRSAAAFGSVAVVVQKLHAPEVTGVLAKSASGAVEHVPLVREVNLSRTLTQLQEAGFTCIGLAERGESTLAGCKAKGRVAIVLGAEGDGLRRLVAESCDMLARLPTSGEIASLNVSNAAAVALYELARLRS